MFETWLGEDVQTRKNRQAQGRQSIQYINCTSTKLPTTSMVEGYRDMEDPHLDSRKGLDAKTNNER